VCHFFPYFVHRSDPYLVLHPWHKLSYFRSAGWEPQWIETAEQLVRSEFKRSYASHSVTLADDVGTAEAQEDDKVRDCIVLPVLIIDNGFSNMQDDDSTVGLRINSELDSESAEMWLNLKSSVYAE
jgi:hypothetical protein